MTYYMLRIGCALIMLNNIDVDIKPICIKYLSAENVRV